MLDIVIGYYGYFESCDFFSSLALYKNTGTLDAPEFTLITRDYAGLLVYNFIHIKPAFYDMDNDGDTDLIIGDVNGNLHYFRNTAPAGSESVFVLQEAFYKGIDVGISAAPFIADLNNDGLPDMVIGEQNGNLNYYENIGLPEEPAFALISEFWGEVDVRVAMSLTGRSAPFLFRDSDNQWQLLVGSESGTVFHYTPTSDWTGAFELITKTFSGIDEGDNSTLCFADITNDGIPELLTGNYRGGISLYREQSTVDEISENPLNQLIVFPNPVSDYMYVHMQYASTWNYQVADITGKLIQSGSFTGNQLQCTTTHWSSGLYILAIQNESGLASLTKVMKL
ncbi:MAG: FG-GAP-like repeat-containing protein [Chitinophagales bacterium]